jgi:hypothetical protein
MLSHPRKLGRRRVWFAGAGIATAATVGVWLTLAAPFASAAASFNDNFESGLASSWSKSGGTWSIVSDGSNVLSQSSTTASLAREFNGDTGWTDYSLSAKVKPGTFDAATDFAGIASRASSSTTFYRLALFGNRAELEAVKSGTVTVLGGASATYSAGTWYTLLISTSGSTITGYVNGTAVASGTSSVTGAGRIGLQTYRATAEFDGVTVTAGGTTASPSPTKTSASPTASPTASPSPTRTASAAPTPTTATSSSGTPPAWPTATGSVTVTATISVSGTYDGKLRRFTASGLGDGDQSENQKPVFDLPNGGTLENVIIGAPGVDGIHCEGTCVLRNVWWEDVGEDAATFKSKSASDTMTVDGGGAAAANDKVFQHNGAGTFIIENFQVDDIGKLYRSCGNCSTQYERHAIIRNIWATYPGKDIAGINTNYGDTATFSQIKIIGDTTKKIVICAKFTGNSSGAEPVQTGSGADGTNCLYSSSDITYSS